MSGNIAHLFGNWQCLLKPWPSSPPGPPRRQSQQCVTLSRQGARSGYPDRLDTGWASDTWWVRGRLLRCYARPMRLTERQLLDALARMPFVDTLELAVILGEAYATVHRALSGLLADGIARRVNHGTVHLPSSGRWFPTVRGISEAQGQAGVRDAVGVRAGVPGVASVACAAAPPDGCGRQRVPPGDDALPRYTVRHIEAALVSTRACRACLCRGLALPSLWWTDSEGACGQDRLRKLPPIRGVVRRARMSLCH